MANSIDRKVFDFMTTAVDKTEVDFFPPKKEEASSKNIHRVLMAAGFSPAWGNVADVADATLYALEGEFGEAGWSLASAIPVIGQMVAGKRALKVAKESGEEMITLYRGVDKWFPGKMVEKGKFIGGGHYRRHSPSPIYQHPEFPGMYGSLRIGPKTIFTSPQTKYARKFQKSSTRGSDMSMTIPWTGERTKKAVLLEFEVPKKYIKKHGEWRTEGWDNVLEEALEKGVDPKMEDALEILFQEGIPKEFLKKVHK